MAAGYYSITATDANGCYSATSQQTLVAPYGIYYCKLFRCIHFILQRSLYKIIISIAQYALEILVALLALALVGEVGLIRTMYVISND